MRWQPLILAALLAVPSALAQGNFLYTWHGNSGYFQASFQIPPEENQPGQYFEDGTFKATFTLASPTTTYPAAGGSFSGEDASGFNPNLVLSVTTTDPNSGTGVHVVGIGSYPGFYAIEEYQLTTPSVLLWRESGYWTSAAVPEPSAPRLAALALLSFYALTNGYGRRRRIGLSTTARW
jgi:hypothetical protein